MAVPPSQRSASSGGRAERTAAGTRCAWTRPHASPSMKHPRKSGGDDDERQRRAAVPREPAQQRRRSTTVASQTSTPARSDHGRRRRRGDSEPADGQADEERGGDVEHVADAVALVVRAAPEDDEQQHARDVERATGPAAAVRRSSRSSDLQGDDGVVVGHPARAARGAPGRRSSSTLPSGQCTCSVRAGRRTSLARPSKRPAVARQRDRVAVGDAEHAGVVARRCTRRRGRRR